MERIDLYTEEDARRLLDRGATGIDCSIRKWQRMEVALCKMDNMALSQCGLCIEHNGCKGCPVAEPPTYVSHRDSPNHYWFKAEQAINNALGKVRRFLTVLEDVKKEQKALAEKEKKTTEHPLTWPMVAIILSGKRCAVCGHLYDSRESEEVHSPLKGYGDDVVGRECWDAYMAGVRYSFTREGE